MIRLVHGDGRVALRDRPPGAIVVTDPPMELAPMTLGTGDAHFIVHPHVIWQWLGDAGYHGRLQHVSAWLRHSPGIERDGFGHHWNAVLHYGPAELPMDVFWDDEPRTTAHPAERGVRCLIDLLNALPDGPILDPFAGSGSVLLAARAVGRDAVGYELDPGWYDVARRRLEVHV